MTFTLGALANARTPWEAIATQARAIQEVQDDGGERKANEGRTSLFKSTMSYGQAWLCLGRDLRLANQSYGNYTPIL